MALGGGTFTSQNKVLPGSYINFVSAARAGATLSERGTVTMGLELDWGPEGVFEVTSEDLIKNTKKIFGYAYGADELTAIRDIFCHATKLYAYRLNGGGEKASNTYATARYSGIRGNDIKIVIRANVDDPQKYDVKTYLDTVLVDTQTVLTAEELQDNDYVAFKPEAELDQVAGAALTGGTNKPVTGEEHQAYLTAIEPYSFQAMAVMTEDAVTNKLYIAFTKRMRDEVGAKFQCIVYNTAADHEGIINVKNGKEIIPWVLGAEGGCAVNQSCTNMKYDGETEVSAAYTQSQLEAAILAGEFVLHKVGDEIHVLSDLNSLTTLTSDKGEIFQSNQSIRVMDQIANDIAVLFKTKYLGSIANDQAGRNSLWLDIVMYHQKLQTEGAIESFSDKDVTVEAGEKKHAVVVTDIVTIVNAMEKLYMTVTVE